VAAVRSPGEPQGILEGSIDDFDGDTVYPDSLPGGRNPMVTVNQIVVVVLVADHADRRKFVTAPLGFKIVLHHIRP
jgi:hypothetical protein